MSDKIVNHFVLADGSTAKYDAGGLLNLDETVSLAGYAPDAKAVGDRLTDVENLAETLNEGGLELKDSVIESQVDTWLDDHPEATTTVQDGAITKAKINTAFLPEIKNVYVTPEMFGAVGDGTTDDTAAIQAAINANNFVVFANKTYLIADSIIINKIGCYIDASTATIYYTGTSDAVVLTHCKGSTLIFNVINAPNGNPIRFESTQGTQDSVQYVNLYFNTLYANTESGSCIYAYQRTPGWLNQINIKTGQFARGQYAVKADVDKLNMWYFDRVGIEGVTNGFLFDVTGQISRFTWNNCRYEEYTSQDLITINGGGVSQSRFNGDYEVDMDRIVFNNVTINDFKIDAPIIKSGENFVSAYGWWYTQTMGEQFLTFMNVDEKNRIATLYSGENTTLSTASIVTSGTVVAHRKGKSVTIVFNNIVISANGTIVSTLPDSIKPNYAVYFTITSQDNTAIGRGNVDTNGTIYLNVSDVTKTYRGCVTYTMT